jgi:hypothetical protein
MSPSSTSEARKRRDAKATPEPSLDVTYRWADGDPVWEECAWMDSPDPFTEYEGDEPREYVEERWVRTEAVVHIAFPPLYACSYEDQEPCEENAVVWQREGDVWMQACERHRVDMSPTLTPEQRQHIESGFKP